MLAILSAAAFGQTTTLNLSQDLVRLGIASTNMVPNQPSLDSGPLMENGVQYAMNHQINRVIADPGSFYFLSVSKIGPDRHVALGGTSNGLTIDLQGSDLYLAIPNKNGIGLYAGTNTTLQNFTVDYLQQHYTQLLVTAVNASQRQIQFTVQPGWQKPSALNALLNPTGLTETDIFVFRNGQPWASYTRMPAQSPFTDDAITIGSSPFTSSIPTSVIAQIRPGDIAVLTVRNNTSGGLSVLGDGPCSGCTFRNIKIYSGYTGFYLWGQSSWWNAWR